MSYPCLRGRDKPCGNARLGPLTPDQCPRCWIALHHGSPRPPVPTRRLKLDCVHLDRATVVRKVRPDGSTGDTGCRCLPAYACRVKGECTLRPHAPSVANCWECASYRSPDDPVPTTYQSVDVTTPVKEGETTPRDLVWSYGITTVPSRIDDGLFDRTLASLVKAGFDRPHVFLDGRPSFPFHDRYDLPHTVRSAPARTAGNWVLALHELWVRDPHADRYAIFQDDFVTCLGLRSYLDGCPYPDEGYLNLYTFPRNEPAFLRRKGLPAPDEKFSGGWYPSDQMGKGAVALVFDHETTRTLLASAYLVDRFMDRGRGHRAIDGGIVEALKRVGVTEYVHSPALVQHTGDVSSMGNARHSKAETFVGEGFDARSLSRRES